MAFWTFLVFFEPFFGTIFLDPFRTFFDNEREREEQERERERERDPKERENKRETQRDIC